MYSVSGTVSGLDGIQYDGVGATLIQAATGMMSSAHISDPQQNREFKFDLVTEGEHDLQAFAIKGSSIVAASPMVRLVIKNSDVMGLDVRLKPLASLSITVAREVGAVQESKSCGSSEPLNLAETLIRLRADGGSQATGRSSVSRFLFGYYENTTSPQADGRCRLAPTEAGRYRLEVEPPNDRYYVHSITQASNSGKRIDIAKEGLQVPEREQAIGVAVKLSPGAASLFGRVLLQTDAGFSASNLSVFLVPAEPESGDDVLRFAETRVSAAGEFTFKHIRPGQYYIVARPSAEQAQETVPVWWDNERRARLREEAEKSGGRSRSTSQRENRIELAPCARVQHVLRYGR